MFLMLKTYISSFHKLLPFKWRTATASLQLLFSKVSVTTDQWTTKALLSSTREYVHCILSNDAAGNMDCLICAIWHGSQIDPERALPAVAHSSSHLSNTG
jgi:hypothetical protein